MPKKTEPPPESMMVGAALRRIREARHMSLAEAEAATKIDQGNLSRLERGKQGFSMDGLARLCKAYGVTLAELFTETGKKAPVGKLGVCIRVPEVEIDFARVVGGSMSDSKKMIRKTGRHINTTAKVGNEAYAFQLNGDQKDEMSAKFPEGVYVVMDPQVQPRNECYVLALCKGHVMFRQFVVKGGRRFLKALDVRYPLVELGERDQILGVAIETNMRLVA